MYLRENRNRWFICRQCQRCFQGAQLFINHKLINHSNLKFEPEIQELKPSVQEDLKYVVHYPLDENNAQKKESQDRLEIHSHEENDDNTEMGNRSINESENFQDTNRSTSGPLQCDDAHAVSKPKHGKKRHELRKSPLKKPSQRLSLKAKVRIKQQPSPSKSFNCKFCVSSFKSVISYRIHEYLHTGEKQFKCKYCHQLFSHNYTLAMHERIHTGDMLYACDICNEKFQTKESLEIHLNSHFGKRPFKCKLCPSSFSAPGNLQQHEKLHAKQKPFRCSFCPKTFALKSYLAKHSIRCHGSKKPSYPCPECGKSFCHKPYVAIHIRKVHNEGKPIYTCHHCEKGYNRKCSLQRHLENIHSEHKQCFKKNLCGKKCTHLKRNK